jgi:hypothetical protein
MSSQTGVFESGKKNEAMRCLAEAIAWCSLKVDLSHVATALRTPALRPPLLRGDLTEFQFAERLMASEADTQAAVAVICEQRRMELARLGVSIQPVDAKLGGGRLLRSDFDSDFCAVASHCCEGFFDLADVPAWDGWFWHRPTGHLGGFVYSWVPQSLLALVDEGIRCMPVESSQWAQSLDELFQPWESPEPPSQPSWKLKR